MLRGALGALLLMVLAACTEEVTGSLGCPQLCGDQNAQLRDTTLTGVLVQDSTLTGFPLLGTTRDFNLIAQGDTADVRIVTRFDTLPNTYRAINASADSVVRRIDSTTLIFVVDTSIGRPAGPITIDAFDVDTTTADSLPRSLIPLFRSSRLIGSATYLPSEVRDTLRLPINNAVVLSKATAGARLRIGLQIRPTTATSAPRLRVAGSEFTPRLRFRVSADTAVPPDTVVVVSRTPSDDVTLASVYGMYPIFVSGPQAIPGPGRFAIGGVGGTRTFLRFNIPDILLDSVQVIRASLQLQQVPSRVIGGQSETLTLFANPVLAGAQVTDVLTLSQFIGVGSLFGIDSVNVVPKDSVMRSFELVNLFQVWRGLGTDNSVRAIVLRAKLEGSSPAEANFVSMEGPVALRPRLRLTYVPRRGFGLP